LTAEVACGTNQGFETVFLKTEGSFMENRRVSLVIGLAVLVMCFLPAFQGNALAQAAAEDTVKSAAPCEEELQSSVPELRDLHEVVYPLWHTAYPNKDYAMIKELLPEMDELVVKVDAAKLPGILRDKQVDWEKGKALLKTSLKELHVAAEADDQEALLKQTEAFHSAYEGLVRTIRPIAPELDAFHKELYKLYHYYAPEYDLTKIREAASAMREKVPPLKEAKLPKRVADRQKEFDAAVAGLDGAVAELAETVKTDDKEAVLKAVEKVHSAYRKTEAVFE
jgi:soluble cytochrome b562